MSLLFFNPWNDLALASGDAHYTPPASAMQMAQDLRDLPQLWAPHDSRHLSVWGWSPLLVTQLREKGVDEALLPSAEQMAAYRAASSRQTAVRLLARWRERFPEPFGNGALVGESKMCMTLQEVLAAVTAYGNEAMLKAPWSGSGRGVHPVHGGVSDKNLAWVTRTLQRQGGVEVEPSYNKVVDFAMEFWSENGQVRYEGLSLFTTTAGGVYSGNLVASEQEKEQRLVAYIPLEQLAEVRWQVTALLNEALNDAAINKDGEVIDASGNVIDGCTADLEKGIVTDGYGNEIEVDISALLDEDIDPTADNPDIAAPPEAVEGDGQDDTTWTGASSGDEEEEEDV